MSWHTLIGERAIIMNRGQIATDLNEHALSTMKVHDLMAVFLETQKDPSETSVGCENE